MPTPGDMTRKASARSYSLAASRFPLEVGFSALPGATLTGTSGKLASKGVPGSNGIEDGFSGFVKVPWLVYCRDTGNYSQPFEDAGVTIDQVERGTITVNGIERVILSVDLNSIRTILEIKVGGKFDG